VIPVSYRAILDVIDEAVIVIKNDLYIAYVNKIAVRLTNLKSTLIGCKIDSLFEDSVEESIRQFKDFSIKESICFSEGPAVDINGKVTPDGLFIVLTIRKSETSDIQSDNTNDHWKGVSENLIARVKEILENEKRFILPQLTLTSLAKELGTNRSYLSKVINCHYGMSFPRLLNTFRVKEYIILCTNPATDNLKKEHLMTKAGFCGKATFHSAFKNITGKSPGEYIREICEQE
jgi:AraC-like DNA-binding protein